MIELIGHFHPLLVHLPLGILMVALLLQWLAGKEKYASVKEAVPVVLLWGSITALLSCITGYFLSISDDYDKSLVNWHMWMAIAVVLTSAILYAKEKNPAFEVPKRLLSLGLLGLLLVTGHLGGSLTHGSDYLTKPFLRILGDDTTANTAIKPLPNVQEALAYNDVVKPILQTKCYSCHNSNKQKGRLRMDDIKLLMKGGKNGKIIDLNNADSSEMIKRMLLPVDDEHHMPPKEKPQPTENQVALLHWWISNQADFTKKVKELNQTVKIKPILLALESPVIIKKESTDIPVAAVEKADNKVIEQLTQKGFLVLPVTQNSNYLMASFEEDTVVSKEDMQLLQKLKKQLIWLKINTTIQKEALLQLPQLTNIIKLNLSKTNITDKEAAALQSLDSLHYLNMVGTKVTAEGIMPLKKLKSLHSLFLYETNISRDDFKKLKLSFVKTQIDSGNYFVPTLVTDTTIVKEKKK
ncbi:c-type cytochrome domain-containing protein [Segetibacter koreensis]|uniref:c-type cytochrome domain-containing protein n=1 Tax=Segetibacter koreensis TaxID=398037 RepID=UPI00037414DF|nr:c-type cytochrome domain-containing protein [Segetibacter koreensis]